jgi:hypothetical protein
MNDTLIAKLVFDCFPTDRRNFICPTNMDRPTAMTVEQTWDGLYPAAATADIMILVEHNNNCHMKGTPNA